MKRCLTIILSICMIVSVFSTVAVYAANPTVPVGGWYGYTDMNDITTGTDGTHTTVELVRDPVRGEVVKTTKKVYTNEYTNWRFPKFATYEVEEPLPLGSETPVIVEFWIKTAGRVIDGARWGNVIVHLNDIPFLMLFDSMDVGTRSADSYGEPFFKDQYHQTVQENEWAKFRFEITNSGDPSAPTTNVRLLMKKNESDDWISRDGHWQGDSAKLYVEPNYGEKPITDISSISIGYSMNYDTTQPGSMRRPKKDGELSVYMDDIVISDGTPIVSVRDEVDLTKVPIDQGTMSIAFSEDVVGATSSNISLYDVTDGVAVSTSGVYEKNVYTMTMPELKYGHDYEIRFNKENIYNNAFETPLPLKTESIAFKTELEPTYVKTITPANEETNVPLENNRVVINFNKPVLEETLASNISVVQSNDSGDEIIPFTGDYDAASSTYTMTLNIPKLGDDCKYTVTVKNGIMTEDESIFRGGVYGFYSETERPRATITNIDFKNGETMFPVSGRDIAVTFSKDMDQSTITKDTVKVIKSETDEQIDNYSLSYSNKVLTISFTSPLENLTEYKLEVSKEIKDVEYGKMMFVGEERTFTTIDTTPVVTSLKFNGIEVEDILKNTNVESSNIVEITFDKDMVDTNLTDIKIVNADTGAALDYVPVYEDKTATLTVSSLFDFGSTYEIVIPDTLKSVNNVNINEKVYTITTTPWIANDSFDEAANMGTQPQNWPISGTTNSNLKIEEFDGKLVARYYGAPGASNSLKRSFAQAGGKVVISFDMFIPRFFPASLIVQVSGNQTANPIQMERNSTSVLDGIGWNNRGNIIRNRWNSFKIIVDTETDMCSLYLNGRFAYSELALGKDFNYISSVDLYWYNFMTEGDLSTEFYLDNFKVSQLNQTRLIGAMASGVDVLTTGTVTSDTNELTLEFSNKLDEDTISSSNIKLMRNGTEVPYTGTYDNKKYTYKMELSEIFIAGAEYKLVLGEGLLSNEGNPIRGETEFTFIGTSKFDGVVFEDMTLDNNNLTIEAYSEKEEVPVQLIVAKYKDKKMTSCETYRLVIPKDAQAVTLTQAIDASLAEGETLKVMIWGEDNVSYTNPIVK